MHNPVHRVIKLASWVLYVISIYTCVVFVVHVCVSSMPSYMPSYMHFSWKAGQPAMQPY